jgi:hypothetical protein
VPTAFVVLALAGCVSANDRDLEQQTNAREAADCINREAVAIASERADLETAATIVIAKCGAYTQALRRDLLARFPGHRDYIESQLREADELYMAQARLAVARARQAALNH